MSIAACVVGLRLNEERYQEKVNDAKRYLEYFRNNTKARMTSVLFKRMLDNSIIHLSGVDIDISDIYDKNKELKLNIFSGHHLKEMTNVFFNKDNEKEYQINFNKEALGDINLVFRKYDDLTYLFTLCYKNIYIKKISIENCYILINSEEVFIKIEDDC